MTRNTIFAALGNTSGREETTCNKKMKRVTVTIPVVYLNKILFKWSFHYKSDEHTKDRTSVTEGELSLFRSIQPFDKNRFADRYSVQSCMLITWNCSHSKPFCSAKEWLSGWNVVFSVPASGYWSLLCSGAGGSGIFTGLNFGLIWEKGLPRKGFQWDRKLELITPAKVKRCIC